MLAFPLELGDRPLVGQIVISADTARRQARRVLNTRLRARRVWRPGSATTRPSVLV